MSYTFQEFEKMFNDFLQKNKQEFASQTDALLAFIQENPQFVDTDDFISDIDRMMEDITPNDRDQSSNIVESFELYEEALFQESETERRKLIEKSLTKWPDNYDAAMYLIDGDMYSRITQMEHLVDTAQLRFNNKEQVGWSNFEERPYIRLRMVLSELYVRNGLYNKAIHLLTDLLVLDSMDSVGARYLLIIAYALSNNYGEVKKIFNNLPGSNNDDQMVIPYLISSVLAGDINQATDLLQTLMVINPDFEDVILEDEFPYEEIMSQSMNQSYEPNTFESLAVVLSFFMPLLTTSEYLLDFIDQAYMQLLTDEEREPAYDDEDYYDEDDFENNDKIIAFPNRSDNNNLADLPFEEIFESLSKPAQQAFEEAGIRSVDDLEKMTKKEISSLHGVGPKTLEQLEANNISFKEE